MQYRGNEAFQEWNDIHVYVSLTVNKNTTIFSFIIYMYLGQRLFLYQSLKLANAFQKTNILNRQINTFKKFF